MPPSLVTPRVPVVAVLVLVLMNAAAAKLSSVCALVAVPRNNALATVVLSCTPGEIVAKPSIAGTGVKVASLLIMATMVLCTINCRITCCTATLSVTVVTVRPPVPADPAGPISTKELPFQTLSC